jgi:hypothetical protein
MPLAHRAVGGSERRLREGQNPHLRLHPRPCAPGVGIARLHHGSALPELLGEEALVNNSASCTEMKAP